MENTSGLVPVDLRILIKPDVAADKIGSIHLADVTKEKQKYAGTKGVFIAAGENAFADWGDGATKPQPGDRVLFAQYSGAEVQRGADGERYSLMNDKDLLAVISAEPGQ